MPPRLVPTARSEALGAKGARLGIFREARHLGNNSFVVLLDHVRHQVDLLLGRLFETKLAEARPLGSDVVILVEAIRDLTMRGGKRLRPALLMAAYHAVDPRAPELVALEAGVALELLQTYLLVHDDWMDQDEMRRGGPAVHVMLAQHYGSGRLGDAAAILAGDYAAGLALEALAAIAAPADRIARSLVLFAQVQQDAIRGQQIDLGAHPDDIEVMHDLKAGSYTVRGPVLLGATLAGASARVLAMLGRFARPLGVAFQLRDDLIGAFGDPRETGKPAGSDIRSAKRTALMVEALSRIAPADRRAISETVGRPDASEREIGKVVAIYERCGARRAVERRLGELVKQASSVLGEGGLSKRGSAWLADAAAALTSRRR